MASSIAHLVAIVGSLSGQIFLSRWLPVWCLFLAAFGVESVQPFSPVGAIGVELLFAAVVSPRQDGLWVLFGIGGRLTGQKVAFCLPGAFFCTFLKSTMVKRMLIYFAQLEWQ